ncbi:protein FAM83B isoform X1 [Astyanax mexicanus]|uniref:protein FAM83B isoform X1 n=2 Tax=Astyanax mexicanus TaxID=7994 RepID=UPI0020CB54E6|nr:protein FAM83B isoform X1 [Astyanax mexicanus]
MMESNLSLLSSLKEEFKPEDYVQPHYKESYRLAIDSLVSGGKPVYQEFIKAEKIVSFLSEDEIHFITQNAEQLPVSIQLEEPDLPANDEVSTGTYWPTHSDAPPPDLDLGWPEVIHSRLQTNIDLLYHPPRLNSPTIKEVVRKHIQDARQVIAIAMDVFTDVDIFKEVVDASVRGVPVYILLDHSHFKSFLTMAENHEIQIQKLRNMRVRTVKGQEYLCRSGAKFHGAMGHKFLLVDCQTVFFGSYSFMWSYEKIHLSMVQLITGRLVESYDEEFRTLYARSSIPAEFQPQDIFPDKRLNGKVEGYLGHPTKAFERKDHLRHTLDSVYRQTCERQPGFRSIMEDIPAPIAHHSRFLQETSDFNKRHSYAGERQEPSYIPQYSRYGSSNWNVAEESRRYVGNHYPNAMENPYENSRLNMMNRSANLRQSYHGHDKQVHLMQQNLPSLANTSKSFLRSWRIESYLNNSEVPLGESYDYLDPYEMENKPAPPVHSRLRSSLVFKSTIPEHPETSSYTNESSSSVHHDGFGLRPGVQYYPPTQRNQSGLMDSRVQPDEFMLKRRSMQMLDHSGNNMCYNSGRDALYASLGRAKSRLLTKDPEQENLYKRHSVADPRYNSYNNNIKESSSHMYGSLLRRQTERTTVGESSGERGYSQNLKEDQRSVSHHDFHKVDHKDPSCTIWQEPPSRTVSATVLDVEDKGQRKPNGMSSPRFFKKSTKKIKSLLNIPEKRENSPKQKNTSSPKVGGSSDTVLSDDRDYKAQQGMKQWDYTAVSMKSTDSSRLKRANGWASENENHAVTGELSSPRFNTEEHAASPAGDGNVRSSGQPCVRAPDERSGSARGRTSQGQREIVGGNRLYSRFESLYTYENKHNSSDRSASSNSHTAEKHRNPFLTQGTSNTDRSNHVAPHTHTHDNKLGRFIQRVGNLINKNK